MSGMDAGTGVVLLVMGLAALIAIIGALVDFGRRRHERWQVIAAQVQDAKTHRAGRHTDPEPGSPR